MTDWGDVLQHRRLLSYRRDLPTVARLEEAGVTPAVMAEVLADRGDAVRRAAAMGASDWTARWGGPVAVTLLMTEVAAAGEATQALASAMVARMRQELVGPHSVSAVARATGVSRPTIHRALHQRPPTHEELLLRLGPAAQEAAMPPKGSLNEPGERDHG